MTNSPFNDPDRNPLPDANDVEREAANDITLYSLQQQEDSRAPSPHIKQDIKRLRNAFIWLLVAGALLGGVLTIVAAIIMRRVGLLDPPEPRQQTLLTSQLFSDTANLPPAVRQDIDFLKAPTISADS